MIVRRSGERSKEKGVCAFRNSNLCVSSFCFVSLFFVVVVVVVCLLLCWIYGKEIVVW